MRICLVPGSFDPITLGHLDVIQRAAKQYDKVIVAVLVNRQKKPFFPTEQRVEMIKKACAGISGVQVESFEGLLVDFAARMGAHAVVRGLRAVMDFEYEFQLAALNRKLDEQLETVFFMTHTQYMFISSSMVKEIGMLGGDFSKMVPESIYQDILEHMNDNGRTSV